jgi:DNA-binding response OmpR family regulator
MRPQEANLSKRQSLSGKPDENGRGILLAGAFDQDLIGLLRILGHMHWDIFWHTNCVDALASVHRNSIHAILCDRKLPDGDWKDLLQRIQSFGNPPPVIVTSPFWDNRLWEDVRALGGYDILIKPFDADEVLRTVSMAARFRFPERVLSRRAGAPAA